MGHVVLPLKSNILTEEYICQCWFCPLWLFLSYLISSFPFLILDFREETFFHTKKKCFTILTFRFQALYLRPRWVPLGLSRSFTCHFTISSEKRRRPVCPPLKLRQSKVFLQAPKAQFLWGVVEALLTRSKKNLLQISDPTILWK